jgi:hypothetical protein
MNSHLFFHFCGQLYQIKDNEGVQHQTLTLLTMFNIMISIH